jgi:hypothetical protein
MKLTQIMLCVAAAFGVATTSLAASSFPSAPLAISGTLYYSSNNGDLKMGDPIKKVSFSSQSLINLLNASSSATNTMLKVTGKTKIPPGSYFLWNPDEESLTITNKNGFSFPLDGAGYDYGYLDIDYEQLIGSYTLNAKTMAGSEKDMTGIYFYFYDGSAAYNEIELYGTATLTWTYGPARNGSQKAIFSVTMTGCGNDDCYVDDFDAIPQTFSASGSGAAVEPTNNVPFYYEW